MVNRVKIEFIIPDEKKLSTIFQAIKIEMSAKDVRRGEFLIELDANKLIISISADDLVATRALTNSVLRLVKMSDEVFSSAI